MMDDYYKRELKKLDRKIKQYNRSLESKLLAEAYHFSYNAHDGQLRKSKKPYFDHCLEVARVLAEHQLDTSSIVAGLLHDVVEDTEISLGEIEENFGEEIAALVDGVTKIAGLGLKNKKEIQAENYKKMLLSVVKDVRVILIKFADRLHNMRTLEYLPEKKQKEIALETNEVYAPLAQRLGMAIIKWELEDLSLKYLKPDIYWGLVRKVSETRKSREAYIQRVAGPIRKELLKSGLKAKIQGRPKSISSIYQKTLNRRVPFEEMYDLFAIRVIFKKAEECYNALGIIHNIFEPYHEKFRDYIAHPRPNYYQSLHTAIIGPKNRIVEIQIRTEAMHKVAEAGIAAHWRYKEGKIQENELDKQLTFLRQALDAQKESKDPTELMDNLRMELFQEEVFVFTPKGKLLKLPLGSTTVDFAFAVHTDVGCHCIGAKVNGKMVPIRYELKSGDLVEIITSPNQKPTPDWIKFVKTSKARSNIKRWLKESFYDQSLKLGEEILTKNLKKHGIKKEFDLNEIAQSFSFQKAEQLFASIGCGDTSIQAVLNRIAPEERVEIKDTSVLQRFIRRARGSAKGIRVQGLDNLMIKFGGCCHPVPGDNILGFITKGRGIVVHRSDCKNIINLLESPDRKIDVEWDVEKDRHFMVRLLLAGGDRKHFLRDVSESISQTDTNIISIDMKVEDAVVSSNIILEVRNLQHLTRIVKKISQVKGVMNVERLNGIGEKIPDMSTFVNQDS